ncbi:MAG: HEAT repeat domain-containing protein [Sedimentisphaeraceae bacterium JB056]
MKNKKVTILLLLSCVCCFAMDSRKAATNHKLTSPKERAVEVLESSMANPNPLIRMDAIESIVLCRCKQLYPLIEKSLVDPVDSVRFAASLAVGDLHYDKAAGKVDILFQSKNMNEKIGAAYALIKLGDNDLTYHKAIVSALQSTDSTISANAALIMGKLGSKKYTGLLRWALQTKISDDKTQIQAIESLGMLGYKDVDSKAWALMISKRADDRAMGIITMYRLATYDSMNAIKTMLDDDVIEVRLIAAGRLEALNDDSGIDIIQKFFEEDINTLTGQDRSRALIHALDAVRFSRDLKLAEYLPPFLYDDDAGVRIHSALSILSF